MDFFLNPLVWTVISLTVLVFSAIFHEVAHGYVADRFGDPTARLMGRLTLNPKNHIDPFLSILLPLLLVITNSPVIFGGAKPVPVDPFNLKEGRKDIALVSLAGPLTNILIAVIAALLMHIIFGFLLTSSSLTLSMALLNEFLYLVVRINLLLAIFNLLPIPPLDGSKIFALILPERQASAYLSLGSVGVFILFFLLMMPIGGFSLSSFIVTLQNFALNLLGLG